MKSRSAAGSPQRRASRSELQCLSASEPPRRSACEADLVIGWDIGGAHVKACLQQDGEVVDASQWASPLWLGLASLDNALDAACARWPQIYRARHAVTMSGEMVDLFADREEGVQRIADRLSRRFDGVRFFAGDAGWCQGGAALSHWAGIASANWLATATQAARHVLAASADAAGDGLLIDIGSTTTDLIAFRRGAVLSIGRSDAERLASGELVYHGVVRTPLCALAQRIGWRGRELNVMNEFFASSADVYRLSGELNPAHDLHPPADSAAKDLPATRQRLARMIGLDARDGSSDEWLALAHAWRACQVAELAGQLRRVIAAHRLADDAVLVSAGCGDFLVADVWRAATQMTQMTQMTQATQATQATQPTQPTQPTRARDATDARGASSHAAPASPPRGLHYGRDVARIARDAPDRDGVAAWAQVCAPSVAVAALLPVETR